jgi:mono/diheme cytochrome c family protein
MIFARILGIAIITASAASYAADIPGIYVSKCQSCHAIDGSGNTPAGRKFHALDYRSVDVQKQTDEDLMNAMRNGKLKMPSFAGKVSEAEYKELLDYVRSFRDVKQAQAQLQQRK